MKPVLFIVFLALGPALADQLAGLSPALSSAMSSPVASRDHAAADRGAIAGVTAPSGRAWLCGRGS